MDSKGYCHGPQSSLPPLPQSSSSSLSSSASSSQQHQHLQQPQHTADLVIAASSQLSGNLAYQTKTRTQLNAPATQYINCVPVVPVGVQYHNQQSHRRKYTHQALPEYQWDNFFDYHLFAVFFCFLAYFPHFLELSNFSSENIKSFFIIWFKNGATKILLRAIFFQ